MRLFHATEIRREYSIYRTLKALSRQRVAAILKPGGVLLIERAPKEDETTDENLRTCVLRGWVEELERNVPRGSLTEEGHLPPGNPFTGYGTIYRLTDSGWHAIHRTHVIALLALIVGLLAVITGLLGRS
jgi:hypothetical protein